MVLEKERINLSLGNDVRERKDKLPRLAFESHKPVVTGNGLRMVALGVNHQCENGNLGPQGSLDCLLPRLMMTKNTFYPRSLSVTAPSLPFGLNYEDSPVQGNGNGFAVRQRNSCLVAFVLDHATFHKARNPLSVDWFIGADGGPILTAKVIDRRDADVFAVLGQGDAENTLVRKTAKKNFAFQ